MHPGADSASFRHLAYTVNCSGRSFECVDCGVMNGDSLEGQAFCHLFQRGKDDTPELCSLILTRGRDLLLIIALKANATPLANDENMNLNWMNFYRLHSQAVKIFCRQLSQSCLYRLGRITAPRSNRAAFQTESITRWHRGTPWQFDLNCGQSDAAQ